MRSATAAACRFPLPPPDASRAALHELAIGRGVHRAPRISMPSAARIAGGGNARQTRQTEESRVTVGFLSWCSGAFPENDRAMTTETGLVVQKLRLQRGWAQEQLAAFCALNVRTIQRIEGGQTAGAESLKALAAVFEVDFLTLKEPIMEKPNAPTVSAEEAAVFVRVRKIKGFYLDLPSRAKTTTPPNSPRRHFNRDSLPLGILF